MRRYYIFSGILLIVPIVLAAPVLVQEKRQAGVDVLHIPKDVTTMLGKRGAHLDEAWLEYLDHFDNHFALPDESAAAHPSSSSPPSGPDHGWTDVERPPSSVPEKPPPNPESLTGSEYESAEEGEDAPPWAGPSRPPSSTMSDAAHAIPNPGPPSTESAGHDAPLSSPVFPTWFHPDHGSMGAHAPQPNLGPASNPSWPSTEFDSDHRFVVEEPPSRPSSPAESDADHEYQVVHSPPPSPGLASPIESDDEMVDVPPSSPGH